MPRYLLSHWLAAPAVPPYLLISLAGGPGGAALPAISLAGVLPSYIMKKVITYGTYDLLHRGHINLLKRAKEMGDYLIVGLSSDEFNGVKNKKSFYSYEERKLVLEAVRYVDLVIPEHDWEQKARDIIDHEIDVFVMGDDWEGKFDHLANLCEVVYLPRTEGVSTTRTKAHLRLTESSNVEFTE